MEPLQGLLNSDQLWAGGNHCGLINYLALHLPLCAMLSVI